MAGELAVEVTTEMVASPIAELRAEHDSLVDLVDDLTTSALERPSFCSDWTVAQVLSHLGSSAEINVSNLRATLKIGERLPKESYPQLWDRWDRSTTQQHLDGFLRWHGELVRRFEELGRKGPPDLQIETAMGIMSLEALAGMRVREAALHRWDIAVAYDDLATLRQGSVAILIDQLPDMTARLCDAGAVVSPGIDEVAINVSGPDRSFVLSLSESVRLSPATNAITPATVNLSGESLVRLFYGRWRDRHDEVIREHPKGLVDGLRKVLPGL